MKVENGIAPMIVHQEGVAPFALTAADSPLAQPEIMDALEAVDRVTYLPRSDEQSLSEPEIPFDADLASRGLKRLRDELLDNDSSRVLRTSVTDTIPRLSDYIDNQEESRRAIARAEQERLASQRAKQEQQALKDREEAERQARQAKHRQRFQETVALKKEEKPHLNFESFSELSDGLVLDDGPDGLTAHQKKDYQARVDQQVEIYLEDPETLVNDMRVIMHVGGNALRPSGNKPAGPEDETSVYTRTIFDSISGSLLKSQYSLQDLSPELTAKWLDLATALPVPMPGDGQEEVREFMRDHKKSTFTPNGLAMLYGRKILLNSLEGIVNDYPKQFIGKVHMIAMEGLDPRNKTKLGFTKGLIEQTLLNQKQAGNILQLSTGARNRAIQRQAFDLKWALDSLGIPEATIIGGVEASEEERKANPSATVDVSLDEALVMKLYPTVFAARRSMYSTVSHYGKVKLQRSKSTELLTDDDHPHIANAREAFWSYINTPDGSNTLCGRAILFQKEQAEYQAIRLANTSRLARVWDRVVDRLISR